MTDVTEDRGQAGAELSAADELELTERARSPGLKLTGEGGLLGRLTEMVVEDGFLSFARGIAPGHVFAAIRDADPLEDCQHRGNLFVSSR